MDAGKGGDTALTELARRNGQLPRCPLVRTGGGGWHAYLRAPFAVRNSASKIAGGVDIRGVGGYVVAPPSLHASGQRYRWVAGCSVAKVEIPAAPDWLLNLIITPERRSVPTLLLRVVGRSDLDSARRYLAKLPPAISGLGGHRATWLAALVLVRGFALAEDDAFNLLVSDFNPRCEPPWSEKELRHKVTSAFHDGTAEWVTCSKEGQHERQPMVRRC